MKIKPKFRRRYTLKGVLLIGLPLLLIVAGGATYAALFSGGGFQGSINLQSGLVDWWKFDGNVKDSTPYANNGTIQGVVSLTTDRESAANSAYSFNGSTGYVSTANLITNPQVFTISAWFKTSTASGGKIIGFGSSQTGNSGNYDRHIYMNNAGQLYFGVYPGSVQTVNSASSYNNGVWHNVVATLSSTAGMTLYVDGQSVGTNGSITSAQVYNGYWRIGEDNLTSWTSAPSSFFFNGSIDDVRVYNRALSAAEAKALYNQYSPSLNADTGEKGLLGWWKMDGNAKDATPYANTGTVNSATLTTDREAATNSAYSFNGSSGTYIGLGNGTRYQISTGTISAWVKAASPGSSFRAIIVKQNAYGVLLENGFVDTYDWNTSTDHISATSAADGNWHLISFTFQSGVTNGSILYMDGSPVLTTTITVLNQTNALTIGSGIANGTTQNINGSIDDVRIYNRVLSAAEITNLYKSYNSQIALGGSGTSSVNLGAGLIGSWYFNGNAKDATPYSKNGTVSGATLTTDRHAASNSAYSFNGSSNYISLPTVIQPYVALSVSAWFKTSSTSGAIFGYQNSAVGATPTSWIPLLYVGSDGKLRGEFWQGSTAPITSSSTVNDGAWHHVVLIGNTSTQSLYLDNNLVGSLSGTINQLTMTTNQIGTAYASSWPSASGWMYFNGSIDDARVYNRALSANEVTALYSEYQ